MSGEGTLVPLRRCRAYARWRLYCVPYAGGSAGIFRSWQTLLRPEIEIWGVEYPGHGGRMGERLVDNIERLAESIADAIFAEAGMPYALFGHSMGGLVAFEVSHKLAERRARAPGLCVVSGRRAPRLPASEPPLNAAPEPEFVAHLSKLGATPPAVLESPELLELMLPILRNDFRACETYVPRVRARLQMPIATYGGLADREIKREDLRGWELETAGPFALRMFPGDHFFIHHSARQVAAMLELDLANALDRAHTGRSAETS